MSRPSQSRRKKLIASLEEHIAGIQLEAVRLAERLAAERENEYLLEPQLAAVDSDAHDALCRLRRVALFWKDRKEPACGSAHDSAAD